MCIKFAPYLHQKMQIGHFWCFFGALVLMLIITFFQKVQFRHHLKNNYDADDNANYPKKYFLHLHIYSGVNIEYLCDIIAYISW